MFRNSRSEQKSANRFFNSYNGGVSEVVP